MAAKKPFVDNGRTATAEELVKVHQWFRASIPVLRELNKNGDRPFDSKGVHVRYGVGLGRHFSKAFGELSLNKVVGQLAEQKLVCSVMGQGGPSYFLWNDKPDSYKAEPVDSSVIEKAINDRLALIWADDITRMNAESPTGEIVEGEPVE